VLAHHHGVPFVVAAPVSTIVSAAAGAGDITVEQRPGAEVTTFAGTAVTPPGSPAHNPAFDVTGAALVTALVTEHGVAQPVNAGTLQRLRTGRGSPEGAPTDVSVER